MAQVLRCYQNPQQGVHYFSDGYYEVAGFGTPRELEWYNDPRVFWKEATAAMVAAVKARYGL